MKKNTTIIILITFILILGITFFILNSSSSKNNQNTNISKISTNINTNINTNTSDNTQNISPKPPIETELASFSTKIYTKEDERQNNITIACQKLHDTTVDAGEIFSFCDTLGPSTSAEGYQEADIFINGEISHALGGGKCQISTTLYNAVLNSPHLEVLERHEHSGEVPYIEDGKDAAVSYGSYDFKFKNNTGKTLKIYAGNTENNITIRLVTIE